jgi:hypothetical protein
MNWKKLLAIGAVAAVAYPILKKKGVFSRHGAGMNSGYSPTDSGVDNMGGAASPATETWAQGGGQ